MLLEHLGPDSLGLALGPGNPQGAVPELVGVLGQGNLQSVVLGRGNQQGVVLGLGGVLEQGILAVRTQVLQRVVRTVSIVRKQNSTLFCLLTSSRTDLLMPSTVSVVVLVKQKWLSKVQVITTGCELMLGSCMTCFWCMILKLT